MSTNTIPHWDLSNVYPSLESKEFDQAISSIKDQIDTLELFFINNVTTSENKKPSQELAQFVGTAIEHFNSLYENAGTTRAYIQSFVTTNSRDEIAMKKMSEFDLLGVRIQILGTQFQAWVGTLTPILELIIPENETTKIHAFALRETAEQSKYLMKGDEEALAAELSLSGAGAWGKLQGTVTSQLSVQFELDGKEQKLSMPALINLHTHPNENVRERAYKAEMVAWKTIEEPLTAAMNGVKGAAITINKRRGREDALQPALDMARIDRTTLDAMLSAMHDSFPAFQSYFQAKAKRLGKEKLAWWDIFAPTVQSKLSYTWNDARDLILRNFNEFSPDLAAFAKRAFENQWIDAEQRDGKRGGAFCMPVPGVEESRILCNFDGTLDQVSTIAHELGHAFHNECAYRAGKTEFQKDTPMTLAETASIMCETIIMEAAINQTNDPDEQLAILETRLIGDAQVIVDIYARYLFETEVFNRRAESELSANDLCEIMEKAQKATYGEGLDERYLMKYMWTWKPHYYYSGLSFYNFPYAFGLLFSTGLYAIYQQRGAEFVPDYINLLSGTGEASAADLAQRFGIDIHDKKFWTDSLNIITKKIELYKQL
ncbi:MAG: M3 family oligoendopeptidase [Chloroflexi bacterium]|nr:M3 family oligoendopeptidase [Chloroflexota bacterium]